MTDRSSPAAEFVISVTSGARLLVTGLYAQNQHYKRFVIGVISVIREILQPHARLRAPEESLGTAHLPITLITNPQVSAHHALEMRGMA